MIDDWILMITNWYILSSNQPLEALLFNSINLDDREALQLLPYLPNFFLGSFLSIILFCNPMISLSGGFSQFQQCEWSLAFHSQTIFMTMAVFHSLIRIRYNRNSKYLKQMKILQIDDIREQPKDNYPLLLSPMGFAGTAGGKMYFQNPLSSQNRITSKPHYLTIYFRI